MIDSVLERQTAATVTLSLAMAVLSSGCSPPPPAANSFTDVYTQVIGQSCTTAFCHYEGAAPGGPGSEQSGLDISSQTVAYWNLVDQLCTGPFCTGSGNTRVIPGDAAGSILYQKVQNPPPLGLCGIQMPAAWDWSADAGTVGGAVFNGVWITTQEQTLIETWIKDGAQNN